MVENKDNKPEGNNTNTTFEAAIARLEEIVRALESGGAPLDESLSLFEEGVSLVKLCNEKLDAAEQKLSSSRQARMALQAKRTSGAQINEQH